MISLEELLDAGSYVEFMRRLGRGEFPVPEYDEWLSLVGGDKDRLERLMITIARKLAEKKEHVLYPVDMIVIPRYPLSKAPMVRWGQLARSAPTSSTVTSIKYFCSKLGPRINAAFVMRGWVLIDIDGKPKLSSVQPDVETRRGYHILRKIRGADAVLIKLGSSSGTKVLANCNGVRVEIMSGPGYLAPFPKQHRYLTLVGGKISVKKYHLLSKEAQISVESADTTLLEATPNEIADIIRRLLQELGRDDLARELEVRPVEGAPEPTTGEAVRTPETRFNESALPILGTLSYTRFKDLVAKVKSSLPTCLKEALFGQIEKGYRWFHLRLLCAVLPYFVFIDPANLDEIINDFAERSSSSRSDVRKWFYDFKYFSGTYRLGENKIIVPSRLGLPSEAWSAFEELGYCNNCPIANMCRGKPGAARRKIIVRYVEDLITPLLGENL